MWENLQEWKNWSFFQRTHNSSFLGDGARWVFTAGTWRAMASTPSSVSPPPLRLLHSKDWVWAASTHESTLKTRKMRFPVVTYTSVAKQLLEDAAKLNVMRSLKRSTSKSEFGGTNLQTLCLRPITWTQKLNTDKENTERHFRCAGITLAPSHQKKNDFFT